MQEAVNSEMLWLTKCQKKSEVCSHLLSRQKHLVFKEVDDLRSDQGYPRYSSTQYVRWHVRKQWEELPTCAYWWLCVHTFTRLFHLCLCVYFHKTDIPQLFKPVVRDKIEMLTCFLNSCLQERFTKILWLKLTNLSMNWSICQLSIKLHPLVTTQ